ncbi:hypothetical protein ULMA_03170 [Patiriisocius marinus]|uniref:Uncharacterized protein n=1 Tax=Patiriisocius marinus TaxID=1397112 RepID=A0A5J4IM35_9FLAO|nr:hypothetical protein [Patiriisocius marinus]GER58209.1 hypothetical protein ULMA_03170 [Patiriisocius marinus]
MKITQVKGVYALLSISFFLSTYINAQTPQVPSGFKEYYPIAQRSYLSGGFGNNEYEQILLDAKPSVYYSFYNDIREAVTADEKTPGYAVYLSFQPQIRIYNEESKPVKTPSYKILFGWQPIIKTSNNNFLTLGIESGHYSNGQSNSAFSAEFEDESPEGQAVYNTITDDTDLSEILNRETGNFSTNLTKISFNYRQNKFTDEVIPKRIHSYTVAYQIFHDKFFGVVDFGGYNPKDRDILGRHRFEAQYEFTFYWKGMRLVAGQDVFLQLGAHPSVTPYRTQTRLIVHPWNTDLGFYSQFDYGFDDYNYRFVDSYPRLSFGISWDWFTPFLLESKRK